MKKGMKLFIKIFIVLVLLIAIFAVSYYFIKHPGLSPSSKSQNNESVPPTGQGEQKPDSSNLIILLVITGIILAGILFYIYKKNPMRIFSKEKIIHMVREDLITNRGINFTNGKGCVLNYFPYEYSGNGSFPRALIIFSTQSRTELLTEVDPFKPAKKYLVAVDVSRKDPINKMWIMGALDLNEALKLINEVAFGKTAQSYEPVKQERPFLPGEEQAAIEAHLESLKEKAKGTFLGEELK